MENAKVAALAATGAALLLLGCAAPSGTPAHVPQDLRVTCEVDPTTFEVRTDRCEPESRPSAWQSWVQPALQTLALVGGFVVQLLAYAH